MVFEQFAGVYAPIPTPFSLNDRSINFNYIEKHLEFLNQKGIQGIVVLGTNGEFPSLSFEERKNLIAWIIKFKGNLKVIAQTGSSSYLETIELCDYAQDLGVDAFLIVSPYYFKNINDESLKKYYSEIFDRVEHPIFLYSMPQNTLTTISVNLLQELSGYQNLVGLKDSSGDWETTRKYIESTPHLHIFVGNDNLIKPALEFGAGGSISAASNSYPELTTAIFQGFIRGEDTSYLQQRLSDYRNILSKYPIHAATKYILSLRGFDESAVRPPLHDLNGEQKESLKKDLASAEFDIGNSLTSFSLKKK